MTEPIDEAAVFEGVAAIAITSAEMGNSDAEVRMNVIAVMTQVGRTSAADVRSVLAAIGRMPQPIDYSAAERERRRPVEELLGLNSAEEQLAAMLRARGVLEGILAELEASGM